MLGNAKFGTNAQFDYDLFQLRLEPNFIEVAANHPNFEVLMKSWEGYLSSNPDVRNLYLQKRNELATKTARSCREIVVGK